MVGTKLIPVSGDPLEVTPVITHVNFATPQLSLNTGAGTVTGVAVHTGPVFAITFAGQVMVEVAHHSRLLFVYSFLYYRSCRLPSR